MRRCLPARGFLDRRSILLCALATLAATVAAPTAAPAADEAPRILMLGDSQAQGLMGGFIRLFRKDHRFKVIDRTKVATGLAAAVQYDWPAAVKSIVETDHAEVAIIMMGANDRPPIRKNGKVDEVLAAKFQAPYAERVRAIVETLRAAKIPVIWVAHPIVREAKWDEDIAFTNAIVAENAAPAGATIVPLKELFAGPDGAYAAYGKGVDGETTRLRTDDGVHLTVAGYDVLARYLMPTISAALTTNLVQK